MKNLFLTAIAVLSFLSITAQEEAIRFGAKAGLNIASLGGDIEDYDSKLGFNIGAVAEIPVGEKFAIQPELLFSTQGAKLEESGTDYSYEDKLKLNYLNIPVMAKFYVAEGFSIQAGPQIGFLVKAESEYEEVYNGETFSGDEDIKDYLKSVDFGLNFGLGYQLSSGIFIDGRYNLGLSNINDQDDADEFEITNGVIQFSVGYKF
ncbi:porin family protein [Neotamlana laminarinivorans]|uniref:PorT family protein n=1 Tax=Neotamlana laminarinivorans TaxID=2883124 RepID=A0A9X1HZ04_9FLAO|nr:porin family protein [Tamlana laminarinivorans]MCB4797553.1 PorT family protein [Tamlana laminarinivorans]